MYHVCMILVCLIIPSLTIGMEQQMMPGASHPIIALNGECERRLAITLKKAKKLRNSIHQAGMDNDEHIRLATELGQLDTIAHRIAQDFIVIETAARLNVTTESIMLNDKERAICLLALERYALHEFYELAESHLLQGVPLPTKKSGWCSLL